jgi:hypothetical protein
LYYSPGSTWPTSDAQYLFVRMAWTNHTTTVMCCCLIVEIFVLVERFINGQFIGIAVRQVGVCGLSHAVKLNEI